MILPAEVTAEFRTCAQFWVGELGELAGVDVLDEDEVDVLKGLVKGLSALGRFSKAPEPTVLEDVGVVLKGFEKGLSTPGRFSKAPDASVPSSPSPRNPRRRGT